VLKIEKNLKLIPGHLISKHSSARATCPKLDDFSEFIDGIRKINGIAWIDSVLITSRVKVLKKILTEEP